MNASRADAERNLNEFLAAYGREGLLELFLTNYLYELVMYYLHSEKNKPAVHEDTGYRFYVDGKNRVYAPEEIEIFKRELRSECRKKAKSIVTFIRENEVLDKLEHEILRDPKVSQRLGRAFESIIGAGS